MKGIGRNIYGKERTLKGWRAYEGMENKEELEEMWKSLGPWTCWRCYGGDWGGGVMEGLEETWRQWREPRVCQGQTQKVLEEKKKVKRDESWKNA